MSADSPQIRLSDSSSSSTSLFLSCGNLWVLLNLLSRHLGQLATLQAQRGCVKVPDQCSSKKLPGKLSILFSFQNLKWGQMNRAELACTFSLHLILSFKAWVECFLYKEKILCLAVGSWRQTYSNYPHHASITTLMGTNRFNSQRTLWWATKRFFLRVFPNWA